MISELVEMLGYCRPHGSQTEIDFTNKYVVPLGTVPDSFGNQMMVVGDSPPKVMWSSHLDTVHRDEGRVPIWVDGNTARVHRKKGGSCLGADCTTGVWIMMEMIRAEVPGLYVFHRGEEVGCLGSEHIREHYKKLLSTIDACIAFDRYGTDSIITHQMSQRGCSEEFAQSMIAQLPGYKTDDGGSYTDSYTYFEDISECTNISVGYYRQHTKDEHQNLSFAQQLRDWMVKFDPSKLVFKRDPTIVDYSSFGRGGNWWSSTYMNDEWNYVPPEYKRGGITLAQLGPTTQTKPPIYSKSTAWAPRTSSTT